MATKRTKKRARNPRRYGSQYGGYVQKFYGDGPYAVEYEIVDSGGYLRQAKMPHHTQPVSGGMWASIHHVRRFKTLRGAVGFFLRSYLDKGKFPEIFLWESRSATSYFMDEDRRYKGIRRYYDVDDLRSFWREKGRDATHEELIEDVEKKLIRKPRRR